MSRRKPIRGSLPLPIRDSVALSAELEIGPPVFESAGVKLVLTGAWEGNNLDFDDTRVSIGMSDDEARALLRYLIDRYPLDAIGGV